MARTKIAPHLEHLVSLGSEVYAGMEWMPEARRELRSLLRVYRAAERVREDAKSGHEFLRAAPLNEMFAALVMARRSREGGKEGR